MPGEDDNAVFSILGDTGTAALDRSPHPLFKGTVARDFFASNFFIKKSPWAPDQPPKFFLKFGFKFAELFEFEFDSPLHNAPSSQILPLHDAVGSHSSPLHDAAGSHVSLLHDAAGNQSMIFC